MDKEPLNPDAPTDHEPEESGPVDLGDGWIEKDGDVERADIEELLPQAEETDGPAPLP